jgi:hypothetical protein
MMTKKNNQPCRYDSLAEKIKSIELKIVEIRNSLRSLKDDFSESEAPKARDVIVVNNKANKKEHEHGELCDCVTCEPTWEEEKEANAAAYEAVRDICIESLLEVDSKGET